MVDTDTFETLDVIQTQNYVFTLAIVDTETIVCGEYQGFVDIVRYSRSQLMRLQSIRPFQANVYKIIPTDRKEAFAFGCGNGLFFGTFDPRTYELDLSNEQIMPGKYITQICLIGEGKFLVSIWNQSGTFIVNRSGWFGGKPAKPVWIEEPRFSSHITDLKPLFPDQL